MTTYSQTVYIHNSSPWEFILSEVWVAYQSGSAAVKYNRWTDIAGDTTSKETFSISPREDHGDFWTVSFRDSDGSLYTSASRLFKANLENDTGVEVRIAIDAYKNVVEIHRAGKDVVVVDLARLG